MSYDASLTGPAAATTIMMPSLCQDNDKDHHKLYFDRIRTSGTSMDPPSSDYNPFAFKRSQIMIYDRDSFESYMNAPQFSRDVSDTTQYNNFIEIDKSVPCPTTAEFGLANASPGLYQYVFEEWNQSLKPEQEYWTHWVVGQLHCFAEDDLLIFANNLIWMRHRNTKYGLPPQKMYIAYMKKTQTGMETHRAHHSDIINATCVFVQPNGFYSTIGMAKGKNFQNGFKGSSNRLHQYIAQVISTKVDPNSIGLLVRPTRRRALFKQFNRIVKCQNIPRHLTGNFVGAYVGSNWDKHWYTRNGKEWVGDPSPLILMMPGGGIKLCVAEIDYNGAKFFHLNDGTIRTPFWESPSPYCNPDGPNNPQAPVMVLLIDTLLQTV
jgi:hypothetical protein